MQPGSALPGWVLPSQRPDAFRIKVSYEDTKRPARGPSNTLPFTKTYADGDAAYLPWPCFNSTGALIS